MNDMGKRVGKALDIAIHDQEMGLDRKEKKRSGLMNPQRRKIFIFLFSEPCATMSVISTGTDLSFATVKWHLDKLILEGLVSFQNIGKRKVYFPMDFIALEDVPMFSLVNRVRSTGILSAILKKPGVTQVELAERSYLSHQRVNAIINSLISNGLIRVITDGVYKRHFPSTTISEMAVKYDERSKKISKMIIKRLEIEALNPDLLRSTGQFLVVNISSRGKKESLAIPLNPIGSLFGVKVGK